MANKPFLPGRGRRPISEAPGGDYGEKWHQQLEMLEKPKNKNKPKELRLAGGVFTINQHFVKFTAKSGKVTGYYELCLNFNPLTGEFLKGEDAVCPICRDFTDPDLPDDLRMYGTYRYFSDAFDVDRIKAGVQEGCFGVVWSNKYGRNDWVKIASTLGCEVDDLNNGCTIHWFYDEHAKDNKDKMSFTKGEPLVVLYNEPKNLLGIKFNGRIFSGTPTNYEEIIKPKSVSEIERDLVRLGLYKKLEEYHAATRGGYNADDAPPRSQSTQGGRRGGGGRTAPPPPRDEGPVQDELFSTEAPAGGHSFGHSAPPAEDGWGSEPTVNERPQQAAPPQQRQAAPPADDGWGTSSAPPARTQAAPSAPPSAPPADDGWGTPSAAPPAASAPADDNWGGGASAAPPDDDFSSFSGGFDGAPNGSEPVDDGW